MRPSPLRPANRACHIAGTSLPTGVTTPNPVTTTRLMCACSSRNAEGGIRNAESNLRFYVEISFHIPHSAFSGDCWLRKRERPLRERTSETRSCKLSCGRTGKPLLGAGSLGFNVLDGFPDARHLLGILIGDLDSELLFERHHELHRVERIRPKVLDEGRRVRHFLHLDPQLLGDDRSEERR